jgi:hypothetical protein
VKLPQTRPPAGCPSRRRVQPWGRSRRGVHLPPLRPTAGSQMVWRPPAAAVSSRRVAAGMASTSRRRVQPQAVLGRRGLQQLEDYACTTRRRPLAGCEFGKKFFTRGKSSNCFTRLDFLLKIYVQSVVKVISHQEILDV